MTGHEKSHDTGSNLVVAVVSESPSVAISTALFRSRLLSIVGTQDKYSSQLMGVFFRDVCDCNWMNACFTSWHADGRSVGSN